MKETRGARDARKRRNKAKQDRYAAASPARGMPYRETLVRQRVNAKRAALAKAYAQAHAQVLVDISKEYYDGEVKYGALRAKDAVVGAECKIEVENALAHLAAIPKGEQKPQHLTEAAGILQTLHQRFINEAKLVPENLRVWDVPQVRIYKDGRVEAINRMFDMDMRDMGQRYLKAQKLADEKLKK